MSIDLKRFVNIDIRPHLVSSVSGTRDTIVLFTAYGTENNTREINSLADAQTYYGEDATTLAYLTMYFNNGGIKALVYEGIAIANLTNELISGLDNKYICIAYAGASNELSDVYTKLSAIASTRALDTDIYGINEKLILARTETVANTDNIKNLVVKYSTVLGAEMTIAAYLSKINVYRINSIFDYAFTQENITAETLTDSNFGTIMENNMNVDVKLSGINRNCGGNNKDGQDLVNNYVRIILHQTLTEKLVNLLTQKIKNTSGLSKIYTVISQELENYLNAGYLTTDKIWTDDDYVITRGGSQYTIISKGTALTNGYVIQILPLSSLTSEEKAAHSTPPIYVVIADQYGIRKITINGEVI